MSPPFFNPHAAPSKGPPPTREPHSGPPPDTFDGQERPSLLPSPAVIKFLSWGLVLATLATIGLTVFWNIKGGLHCSAMRPCPSLGNASFWSTFGWAAGAVVALAALGYAMQLLAYVGDIREYRARFWVWDAEQVAARKLEIERWHEANKPKPKPRYDAEYVARRDAYWALWKAERAQHSAWGDRMRAKLARLGVVERWVADGLRSYLAEHDFVGEGPTVELVEAYARQVRARFPIEHPEDFALIRYTKNKAIIAVLSALDNADWVPYPAPREPAPPTPLMDAFSALSEEEKKTHRLWELPF